MQADKEGLWQDETYLAGTRAADQPQSQNVGLFAAGAAAGMLAQALSFIAPPAGFGEPGPVRFSLSTHWLEHIDVDSGEYCVIESQGPVGDRRRVLQGEDKRARLEMAWREKQASRIAVRAVKIVEKWFDNLRAKIESMLAKRRNSIRPRPVEKPQNIERTSRAAQR